MWNWKRPEVLIPSLITAGSLVLIIGGAFTGGALSIVAGALLFCLGAGLTVYYYRAGKY